MDYSLEQLLAEVRRRNSPNKRHVIDTLFDAQKLFDQDQSRFKAALNTRRSGKTHLAATRLITAAEETENSLSVYISLTRDSAKRIIWQVLSKFNQDFKLKCEMVESSLTMKFPNKSQIFLVGADQKNFMERLRGPKYKRAVIDEIQSFSGHVEQLIDDVLTPALLDLNGDLDVYGTPGPTLSGFFHDITTKDRGYSVHRWSVLDNPHVPNAKEFIEELMQRKGWTKDHPTFQREWLGRWVLDEESLLFAFDPTINQFSDYKKSGPWSTVIGVDFGYNDKTAFVVMSYSQADQKILVDHAEGHPELIVSKIAVRLKELEAKYKPVAIVADEGGLGKSMAEELRQRHQIQIKPAQKREKAARIQLVNDDFRTGRILVGAQCKELIHQLSNLVKNERGIEEEGQPCDEVDAMLYSYSECRHYLHDAIKPEYTVRDEEYLWQKVEEEVKHRQNLSWWEQ